jgi:hypothetical protein
LGTGTVLLRTTIPVVGSILQFIGKVKGLGPPKHLFEVIKATMMDELTIGTVGTIAGIFGLGIAIVSYYKQMQLEKRFKEKERLISLANKLKKLIDWVEWDYLVISKRPSVDDDRYFYLNNLSRAVISSSFDEKMPTISVAIEVSAYKTEISEDNERSKIIIDSKEDVERYINEHKIAAIDISGSLENDGNMSYELLSIYRPHFEILDAMINEYGDLLEKFCPGFSKNLYNCLDDILIKLLSSAVISNEIRINPNDFNKTIDIGFSIYDSVLGVDQLTSNLEELKELLTKAEKIREVLLSAGYA